MLAFCIAVSGQLSAVSSQQSLVSSPQSAVMSGVSLSRQNVGESAYCYIYLEIFYYAIALGKIAEKVYNA